MLMTLTTLLNALVCYLMLVLTGTHQVTSRVSVFVISLAFGLATGVNWAHANAQLAAFITGMIVGMLVGAGFSCLTVPLLSRMT